METMHMTAVGRHEKRSYYILVKEALIEKPLNEIMEKIGSDPLYYSAEDDDDPIGYKNNVQHKVAGKYDIDVIHTSNRVVLIVRAPEKEQKIFRELMRAYSKFQE